MTRFRYIKQAAVRLRDDFGSDVPKTVDDLCSLPGVGPKMAFLCLRSAWNMYVLRTKFLSWTQIYPENLRRNDGIGVDVHVHRISNRLRWHKPATTTPEQTRLALLYISFLSTVIFTCYTG